MNIKVYLTLLLFLGYNLFIQAQDGEIIQENGPINRTGDTQISIPVVSEHQKLIRSDFYVSLSSGISEETAVSSVDLQVIGLSDATEVFNEMVQLQVGPSQLESRFSKELLNDAVTSITVRVVDDNLGTQTNGQTPELKYVYNGEIGFNVREMGQLLVIEDGQSPEGGIFKWTAEYDFKRFQFQLLRLYNVDPNHTSDEQVIKGIVDWQKATTLWIEESQEVKQKEENGSYYYELELTLAEGTGYYAWRIRPGSNYYEGGLANPSNLGEWNDCGLMEALTSTPLTEGEEPFEKNGSAIDPSLPKIELSPEENYTNVFFYTDPQEGRNYIYSRVFTEQNGVKELMTYANALQQSRQRITYLQSENVSMVSHTVLDHSGRPVLNVLPFPVDGKQLNYQEKALVNADGELYSAEDFDSFNSDEQQFEKASEAQTSSAYYSDNRVGNIPQAGGYPFSRIIYANDGTGRVLEQGGVGVHHTIGSGHTTRYTYTTASAEELVALFGAEAPCQDCVTKVIATDANNVSTITYTNKEGQVIATALNFDGDNFVNQLKGGAIEHNKLDLQVNNVVSSNTLIGDRFVSSKAITLGEKNTLSISYSVETKAIEMMCTKVDVSCNFQVRYKIYRVNSDGTRTLVPGGLNETMTEDNATSTDSEVGFDEYLPLTQNGDEYVCPTLSIELEAGNYLVQKELVAGNVEVSESNNISVNDQVQPITNLIIGDELDQVTTTAELTAFYQLLEQLRDDINAPFNNNDPDHTGINTAFWKNYIGKNSNFWTIYELNKVDFYITLDGTSATHINNVVLTTPCCDNLIIPIIWNPPFDCVEDDLTLRGGMQHLAQVPDFESYAIKVLKTCDEISGEDKDPFKFFYGKDNCMDGWDFGHFNEMVYNMIKEADKATQKEIKREDYPDEETYQNAYLEFYNDHPYSCGNLFTCWQTVINNVVNQRCGGIFTDEAHLSSKSIDDREDEGAPNHDKELNTPFKKMFFVARWIIKRKVSRKVRRKSNRHVDFTDTKIPNLPELFLQCTGYEFAKILTPMDALPEAADILPELKDNKGGETSAASYFRFNTRQNNSPMPFETRYFDFLTSTEINKISYTDLADGKKYTMERKLIVGKNPSDGKYMLLLKDDGSHYYLPLDKDDWKPLSADKDEEGKYLPVLPNIHNPFYAYKYFHYHDYGTNPIMEDAVCMTDPNDCYWFDDASGKYGYDAITTENGDFRYELAIIPCCADESFFNPASNPPSGYNPDNFFFSNEINGLCKKVETYPSTGETKIIVSNFRGIGRIKCSELYYNWLPEQRVYFYHTIEYPEVEEDEEEKHETAAMECIDMIDPAIWYQLREVPLNTCGDIDLDLTTLAQYISKDTYKKHEGDYKCFYEKIDFDGYENNEAYTLVEKFITEQVVECKDNCEEKRDHIRGRLTQLLFDHCYEIGGCLEDGPWVIPEEDFEIMVDMVVQSCKEQCILNTFSCQSKESRNADKEKTRPGKSQSEIRLKYGMGGSESDLEYRHDQITLGKEGQLYIRFLDDPVDPLDIDENYTGAVFSWKQYTLLKQVNEWDFELGIECLCDERNQIETDPGSDSLCPNSDATYTTGSDTNVDRRQYEKGKNRIPMKGELEIPVESTYKEIEVNINSSTD